MSEYSLLNLISQRPPFLFLDGILELSEECVKTKKVVTEGDYLSVSAVYIVENMAQSAAALFGYRNRDKICNHMYLAGVESADLKRSLKKGEILVTEVKVILAVGNWGRVECESFVCCNGKKECAANASLTLYID